MLYLGIQSYVASRRGRQDKKGNMLGNDRCQVWLRILRAPPC